ncbi:sugar phosphate nucleotidyltransferase [Micrococcus sp. KRD012]|uniref:sugar phosphate nucleotidyltransferase n=1 Tax=Micrococcus sp. KRD012 TaxID=2729716 RepID=UPI00314001E1
MPEGDSLVRVAHRLRPVLEGRVLTHADLRVPRHATADLTGWTVAEVLPRAKYLLMRLTPPTARPGARPLTLISHLKMEGRWLVSAVDARWGAPAWQVRAVLETAEHRVLGAQLGLLTLVPTADEATVLGHLGPDLLDPAWDTPDDGAALLAEGVRRLTARPERPVGLALLDQRLVSGIGNIYRCETLLLAGIDPHRPIGEVPPPRAPGAGPRACVPTRGDPSGSRCWSRPVRHPARHPAGHPARHPAGRRRTGSTGTTAPRACAAAAPSARRTTAPPRTTRGGCGGVRTASADPDAPERWPRVLPAPYAEPAPTRGEVMADPFPKDPEGAVVALVLAGGTGGRLMPLTAARAKPMVPLAGQYRLIDVVLSNLTHSRLRDVWVVEQYRPFTLNQHLAGGRPWDLDGTRHGLRILPPAQGRAEEGFARGNGHAIAQQLPLLEQFGAETVVVLSADHLYQLDLRPVLAEHARSGAELTVVTTETDEDPSRFGVVQVGDDGAVTDYAYKPEDPAGTLVATEVFVFDVAALSEVVGDLVAGEDEAATKDEGETDEDGDPVGSSLGDYGESIIPAFVARGRVREHRLVGYWRDIGTLDAYVRAHREILEGTGLDVAAEGWPLITNPHQAPPAWVAPDARVSGSLLSPGCRIEGEVSDSVVGPGVVVAAGATVRGSLLLGDCEVPAGAVLDTVVVDVGGAVPAREVTGRAAPAEEVVVLTPQDRGPAEDETTGSGRPGRSD